MLERIILLAASLDMLLTECLAERLVLAMKKLIHSTFRVMPARSTAHPLELTSFVLDGKVVSNDRRGKAAVCTENSDSDVLVVQPTDKRMRRNASGPLNRSGYRGIFVQGTISGRSSQVQRLVRQSCGVARDSTRQQLDGAARATPCVPFGKRAVIVARCGSSRHHSAIAGQIPFASGSGAHRCRDRASVRSRP